MKTRMIAWTVGAGALLVAGLSALSAGERMTTPSQGQMGSRVTDARGHESTATKGINMSDKVVKTEDEWRKELTAQQYHVLREKGTERAFTGDYYKTHDKGVFVCAACGKELFSSDTKFDSGTGWPSFYAPMDNAVTTESDSSFGMTRTEVMCARCGGHLGHVFDDGPKPTGQRYCINSVSLKLEKAK